MASKGRRGRRKATGSGAKSTGAVDAFVGARVRMHRLLVGMSQEKLGEAIGITFQQIQKYEKGTNRISVSRLHQIAGVLGVPVSAFYEGAPSHEAGGPGLREAPAPDYQTDFLSTPDGLKLMRAFVQIQDARVRRRLIDLAEAVAGRESDGPDEA